ncbi:hypothetical protein EDD17DRAFT_1869001 [Pisolithus thermaeus]|nr:hypothetical protein EDD17DRAFT_1869001 [Pisolithus thermaeus]
MDNEEDDAAALKCERDNEIERSENVRDDEDEDIERTEETGEEPVTKAFSTLVSKIHESLDAKTDTGNAQPPSTPTPKHLPQPGDSQETFCISHDILSGDHSGDYLASLPRTIHKLQAWMKKERNKFAPYQKPQGVSCIELRFAEKSLGRHACNNVTLDDARAGKPLLMRGLRAMPDNAFRRALAMKEADREAARLRVLTTAVQEETMQQFHQSADDLWLFMKVMERRSADELKNEEDCQVGACSQDLTSLALEDDRLNQLEELLGEEEERKAVDSRDDSSAILNALVSVESVGMDEVEGSEDDNRL